MSEKHTPGPWKHHKGEVYAPGNQRVALIAQPRSVGDADGDNDEEYLANGLLIAAAPEMLALIDDWRERECGSGEFGNTAQCGDTGYLCHGETEDGGSCPLCRATDLLNSLGMTR